LTRSGAEGQIRFRAVPNLPLPLLLAELPAGTQARELQAGSYLVTGDVTPEFLATLTAWCASQQVLAEDFAIQRRSLEDVFLELTGRESPG
jgi:ABC-2 type transport system ATP-binding protein